MAVLSDADRAALWATFMQEGSRHGDALPLTKADLRAAVDAADAWADANAGSYNAALPAVARAALTPRQKAWLLTDVVRRRFEVS